jgi:hypothetical protein
VDSKNYIRPVSMYAQEKTTNNTEGNDSGMELKVKVDTLNETIKCKRNFSCLTGSKECLCEVEDSFNDKVIFIRPENNNLCDYKMSFGYSYICTCPTRKEIYNIYGK